MDSELDKISEMIEAISPSGYLDTLDRQRPYNGQPWTDLGERGKAEIKGVTMRDLRDCYIRACFESSDFSPNDYPKSVFDLDWEHIDPIAVIQNMTCWVEKYMGIFPNVPKLNGADVWKDIPILDLSNEELGQEK